MLAVFAAVLALAGAPANTPVACVPALTHVNLGQAAWVDGRLARIELSPQVCLAARFAAADREERSRIALAHHRAMYEVLGVGMLALLHEAEHVALQSRNECQVEKAAYAKVPILLRQFGPRLFRQTMASAKDYHDHLPASYRDC